MNLNQNIEIDDKAMKQKKIMELSKKIDQATNLEEIAALEKAIAHIQNNN